VLTPVAEALSRLLEGARPVAARSVPLRAAEGKILAEPLSASGPVPPRSIALRDGWAVAAEEVAGASSYSPVFLPNAPIWVVERQTLPPGADCVLPPDSVSETGGIAEVAASAHPGEGARRAGEDANRGAVLRRAGEAMRALDVAAASAAGLDRCLVREPRVRVLSVGARPDAVSDFLGREAVLAAAQMVHQAVSERTRATALGTTPRPDLILITGDMTLASEILRQNGAVLAASLALRPGEFAACGRVGDAPVVIVPPRVEAALALSLLMIGPCLERLSGAKPQAAGLEDRLTRKISSALGVTEVVLLRETLDGFEPLAVGDLSLSAMGAADHWLAIPPESEGHAAGELVEARPL
jgi:molybdopterin biosynthesis enzyme